MENCETFNSVLASLFTVEMASSGSVVRFRAILICFLVLQKLDLSVTLPLLNVVATTAADVWRELTGRDIDVDVGIRTPVLNEQINWTEDGFRQSGSFGDIIEWRLVTNPEPNQPKFTWRGQLLGKAVDLGLDSGRSYAILSVNDADGSDSLVTLPLLNQFVRSPTDALRALTDGTNFDIRALRINERVALIGDGFSQSGSIGNAIDWSMSSNLMPNEPNLSWRSRLLGTAVDVDFDSGSPYASVSLSDADGSSLTDWGANLDLDIGAD